MLKIGLAGTGHLGKIHLRLLKELAAEDPEIAVSGIFDQDPQTAQHIATEYGVKAFPSLEALIAESDAVDIVTPSTTHFQVARACLKQFRHIFIEKPITQNVQEARAIVSLVHEAGVKAQVGHVERFNPALLALEQVPLAPMFIEGHRLAIWNPRGTDVSVVLDLMIHDIDIVLSLVRSPVKKISANGVAVLSQAADIANARIEFHNGCVANLTASRMSMKNMRKLRLFQRNAYIGIDFLEKKADVMRVHDTPPDTHSGLITFDGALHNRVLSLEQLDVKPVNAIKRELQLFIQAIREDKRTPVTVEDATSALEVAYAIHEKVESHLGV